MPLYAVKVLATCYTCYAQIIYQISSTKPELADINSFIIFPCARCCEIIHRAKPFNENGFDFHQKGTGATHCHMNGFAQVKENSKKAYKNAGAFFWCFFFSSILDKQGENTP